jgi:hypothetical protein
VQVLLLSLLDLPFSISPVVTGLMLMLLYGRAGWFAQALAENGWNIVFAFPGEGWLAPLGGGCYNCILSPHNWWINIRARGFVELRAWCCAGWLD